MRNTVLAALLVSLTLIVVASGGFHSLVMDGSGHARLTAAGELTSVYECRDWSVAEQVNTAAAYRTFLSLYPAGEYAAEAKKRAELLAAGIGPAAGISPGDENLLGSRQDASADRVPVQQAGEGSDAEEQDWAETRRINSTTAYRNFLDRHRHGAYAAEAAERLETFARIRSEWDAVVRENTVDGYREFASKYTGIAKSHNAVGALADYEDFYWETVIRGNAPDLYDTYVKLFPQGDHVEEAESHLITMEVNKIFKDRHDNIPSLNKTESVDMVCPDRSKIVLRNNTPLTLTIFYSGPESRKFTLYPDETTTFGIKNGKHRIAAESRTGQVYQLAGEQLLDGGEYQSTYNPKR